jgi:hypothetical protein
MQHHRLGRSSQSIRTDSAVDRALMAGATTLGARIELTTVASYLRQDEGLWGLFRANAEQIVGAENV